MTGWQKLNWRGKLALLYAYFQVGTSALAIPYAVAGSAAGFKILFPLTTWQCLGLAVLTTPAIVLLGGWWKRHGLLKHQQEVSVVDGWNHLQLLDIWLQIETAERLGIQLKDIDIANVIQRIEHVLASTKAPADQSQPVFSDALKRYFEAREGAQVGSGDTIRG